MLYLKHSPNIDNFIATENIINLTFSALHILVRCVEQSKTYVQTILQRTIRARLEGCGLRCGGLRYYRHSNKTNMVRVITYMGKEIYNRDKIGRFTSFKRQSKKFMKKTIVVCGILSTLGWYGVGMYKIGVGDIQVVEIVREVKAESPLPKVLQRIAQCESGNSHYKNGQVIFNSNTDGSVDIGIMQINSIHSADATKLGYDLTKLEDNLAYARHLYEVRGTEDWYSSRRCWNK